MVAFSVVALLFPVILHFARKHGIVDNPNFRKIHRKPVPVMGGVAVFAGILASSLILLYLDPAPIILWILFSMSFMLMIGIWDDIKGLSITFRFVIEFTFVGLFVYNTGIYVDNLHGLWEFQTNEFPVFFFVLSMVSGVGIINSINMIDGVDGYSSGFCIQACICFSLLFGVVGDLLMMEFCLISAAALLPFFMHNVFGEESKMFIGDGGTMMLGILMTIFAFLSLSSKSLCQQLEVKQVSLIAITMAILSVPIFDTLRVMVLRILRGASPFKPDQTHLHHLFIEMGFSHLGVSMSILSINFFVILVWLVSWETGASIECQIWIVILMGVLLTFGLYNWLKMQQLGGKLDSRGNPTGTFFWLFFLRIGKMSHCENTCLWSRIQHQLDRWYS